MAYLGGKGLQELGHEPLSRRQVLQGLAFTVTAASVVGGEKTIGAAGASEASEKVRKVLEGLVKEGPEIGLQVAAYLDGKLAVDAWAGLADQANKKPVDGDTMFMLSSTTKGVTATCMHVLAEKHKLDYDMPIVKVWPEFGAHGKEKATLRHALSHQTGVPQTPVELHARLAGRLGQDVPRHRRPHAAAIPSDSGPRITR